MAVTFTSETFDMDITQTIAMGQLLTELVCVSSPVREALPNVTDRASLVQVQAILTVESTGRENITSPVGALGPMQIMPITIRELQRSPTVPDYCRPSADWPYKVQKFKWGIRWGHCYIEHLERQGYRGVELLIAYNAGPGRVRKWREDGWLPLETVKYISKVNSIVSFCYNNDMRSK